MQISRKDYRSATGEPVAVLRALEFELAAGAVTALVGPSGCGKTTTLRIMLGLDRDFEGRVTPNLGDMNVGTVFQEPRLLPWRSVEQNVRLALPRAASRPALDDLFEAVGLSALRDRYPAELSVGQARRVALARAFAIQPAALLLDEPFVSVDEATADRLRELLLDLWRADPMTVLLVTHNLREAALLADRIIVLSPRPARVIATLENSGPRDQPRLSATIARLAEALKP